MQVFVHTYSFQLIPLPTWPQTQSFWRRIRAIFSKNRSCLPQLSTSNLNVFLIFASWLLTAGVDKLKKILINIPPVNYFRRLQSTPLVVSGRSQNACADSSYSARVLRNARASVHVTFCLASTERQQTSPWKQKHKPVILTVTWSGLKEVYIDRNFLSLQKSSKRRRPFWKASQTVEKDKARGKYILVHWPFKMF